MITHYQLFFVFLQSMNSTIDIHQVFAKYFGEDIINPIAYACSKKLSEGHICLDLDEYNRDNNKQIKSSDLLQKSQWITDKEEETKAFIIKNNKVYLHRYFQYESDIISSIQKFLSEEKIIERQELLLEHKSFINKIFNNQSKEIDWQLIAVLMSFTHNFSIITGGPGTGKTTSIAKLLSIVFKINPNTKVALVAPTGKAAARIKESILQAKTQLKELDSTIKEQFDKIHSSTIHRLLGYKRGTHYFKHNAENPLNFDIIIADESSMIGISLMSKLMGAIPSNKQIILLGDKNQLASVEAGSIFGDICQTEENSNVYQDKTLDFINQFSKENLAENYKIRKYQLLSEHIVELKKSFRFSAQRGIGKLSKAVLEGSLDATSLNDILTKNKAEILFFNQYKSKDFETFFELYKDYIIESNPEEAIKKLNETRVLCATHKGEWGVESVNQKAEWHLKQKGLITPQYGFYHNQPILITKNNYYLGVFNGDVGLIRKDKTGNLQAYFESDSGSIRTINPNFISEYKTVFAMTIHKSQGSEFNQIALILPEQDDASILSRELVYTGMTRAKQKLWLFSKEEVIIKASSKPILRASGITDRLSNLQAAAIK